MPDAHFASIMQRILDSTPAFVVAGLTIRDEVQFATAMQELITRDILTPAQYDAIGNEIQRQLDNGELQKENFVQMEILSSILERIVPSIAAQIRRVLGHKRIVDQVG
ncbi:MAG: hypothetical protein Greene041662_493 [Candidatus Peregrinibacteria bacterium Greene0416_62]|nr:MAG: hypothetical protein Greene041662_493 [Candidatus Peregrinibacteria bacterium Greene0416_62]TSC97788.1 MAG: hypothetical protein Greene101449_1083 [Candidatus Peregrinibacteria bacterium Greene1014_49]